jgi:hypothetical protein
MPFPFGKKPNFTDNYRHLLMNRNNGRKIISLLMHITAWATVFLLPHFLLRRPEDGDIEIRDIILWALMVVFFYLNYYILVPYYLTRKKFIKYTVSVVIMLFIAFSTERYLALNYDATREYERIRKKHPPERVEMIMRRIATSRGVGAVFFSLMILAVSTSIKVTGDWYIIDRKRKEIENEKLTTELNLLKSQINPHFFFNTLNNIYSLAIRKSERTPEAIVKLSQLMRYIIYDTDKDKVPLDKEIDYLKNYIELEKLRLQQNVSVHFEIEGNTSDKLIEPLLLLPFIENAFKHGVHQTEPCDIIIRIILNGNLTLYVENPLQVYNGKENKNSQGFGWQNAERRLQLLYGKNYKLETNVSNDIFKVVLTLNLKINEMPDSG